MPAIKPITQRALDALKSAGLTLDDVARELGRSAKFLINVINGSVSAPPTSQALADFFGFPFHGKKPSTHLRALILPEGTRIAGLAKDYAATLPEYFGDCALNSKGVLTLRRSRRILFSAPRPRLGCKTVNQAR